jgi:hypothetical protein
MKRIDLTGNKYGKLTVVSFNGYFNRHTHWNCSCSCGGRTIATSNNLVRGNTLSCGCVQKERASKASKKHGLSSHRCYNVWRSMINRCEDHNNIMWHRYGKRGISVCKEWHVFENFIKDMGIPEPKVDIDRIDNQKGYSKDNCRWVSRKVNARNTSKTIMIEWNGKNVPMIELGETYGINYKCLYKRIKSGWNVREALLTKSGEKRSKVG